MMMMLMSWTSLTSSTRKTSRKGTTGPGNKPRQRQGKANPTPNEPSHQMQKAIRVLHRVL